MIPREKLGLGIVWYKYIISMVACFSILFGCEAYPGTNEQWKAFLLKIGVEQDEVLCEDRVDGDHFLIALVDKRLLTAYRVDVTGENGKVRPSIISWSFRNEDGSGLESNIPPDTIVEQFIEERGKLYSEVADYRHLFLEGSAEVQVRIGIQKEGNEIEIPREGAYDLTKLEKDLLCTIPVAKLSNQ